jgi:hypothetical protein
MRKLEICAVVSVIIFLALAIDSMKYYKHTNTMRTATVVGYKDGESINLATTIITGSIMAGLFTADDARVLLQIDGEKDTVSTVVGQWFATAVKSKIDSTGKWSGRVKLEMKQEFFKDKETQHTRKYVIQSLED